jgi:hypothetical protein
MNAHDPRILIHEDIKALAKQAYELAQLPEPERAARKWDAVAVCGQIVGAATPAGLTAAQAALEARWGAQIRAQGLAALVDPWWYLRADDGQPPVIAGLIESAMTNPNRPLASVLRSFAAVEPDKREALTDQVRAFLGRAFAGALGEARLRYVDVMRSRPEFNWPRDPWAAVLPYVQNDPPAQILVDNQGEDHDGGMFDDPDDDTCLGEDEVWRARMRPGRGARRSSSTTRRPCFIRGSRARPRPARRLSASRSRKRPGSAST